MRKRTSAMLIALGLPLIGGCTSGATGDQPPTGSTHSGVTTPAGNTVTVGDTDKGRTVTVAVGVRVTITLNSTYWHFTDPQPTSVLAPVSAPVVSASQGSGCVPGQGCGTTSITYRAATTGTVTASAHRTSCGEARGCPGDEGTYQITVIVQ